MIQMDESKVSTSSPMAVMNEDTTCHSFFGRRRESAVQTSRMKAAKAVREAARLFRIMVFLSSAKDLPSVLRLYGLDGASEAE
jgi:hypothetical protein